MPDQPIDIPTIRARYAKAKAEGTHQCVTESACDVPALLAEVGRLQARFDAASSLTHDTDGNQLNPDSDIPVGELQRALFDVAW